MDDVDGSLESFIFMAMSVEVGKTVRYEGTIPEEKRRYPASSPHGVRRGGGNMPV